MASAFRLPRYFVILAVVWMVAMTWRLYPQFKDTLKVDDHLVTLQDYIGESCGQRIGPAAESCLEEMRETGYRLVAREQGKSILLILAPILGFLLIYLPLRLVGDAIMRRHALRSSSKAASVPMLEG